MIRSKSKNTRAVDRDEEGNNDKNNEYKKLVNDLAFLVVRKFRSQCNNVDETTSKKPPSA